MNPRKRILIADDSPTILKLVEKNLSEKNFEVIKTKNGFEALKSIYQHVPDLIILDILMPLMTGYQVCRILKNHKAFRSIPVIIFTTLENKDKQYRALKTGADLYLQKPVSSEKLYEAVNKLLLDQETPFSLKEQKVSTIDNSLDKKEALEISIEKILFEINEILDDRLHELTVFKEVASLVTNVESNTVIIREFFDLLNQICMFTVGAILQIIDNQPVIYFYGDKIAISNNRDWFVQEACKEMNRSLKESGELRSYISKNIRSIVIYENDRHSLNRQIKNQQIRRLIVKGKPAGLLIVAGHSPFDGDSNNILDLVANQAAVILDHARLYESLQHFSQNQTVRLETVYEIGRLMSSSNDVSDLLSVIIEVITKVMSSKKCSIFMIDRRTMNFFMKLGIGIPSDVLMNSDINIDDQSVSGWVIKNRKPLLIDDINKDSRFSGKSRGNYASASLMCVPIVSRDVVLGVINVTDRKGGKVFSGADLELLALLGNLVAVIIENIKLYNKMKFTINKLNRKNLEISSLADLDEFLGTLKNEEQVADYSILNMIEFLKAQYGAIYYFKGKKNQLVKISEAGDSLAIADYKLFENRLLDLIVKGKRAVIYNLDTKVSGLDSTFVKELGIKSFIAAPMNNDGELSGVIFLINKRFNSEFDANDMNFSIDLCGLISRRIEKKRLYRMIILDNDTGLYKRDFFCARLDEELNRARRYNRDLSVVAFIINSYAISSLSMSDHDRDIFLQRLSVMLKEHVRQVDIISKYDEGKFLFLLPETGKEGVQIFSERLVDNIEIQVNSIFPGLKFSFIAGISVYSGGDDLPKSLKVIEQAICAADDAAQSNLKVMVYSE